MRLIIFAIYLGIGAMLHAMFVGSQFDWASAWTFGWLFGWPIMLVLASWAAILIIAALIGCGWVIYAWISLIANWRHRLKQKRAA
jgi:hypothetical protein